MAKLVGILKTLGVLFAVLSVTIADFLQAALDRHNEWRGKHGVPQLTLKKELIEFAQNYSDKQAREGKMRHSGGDYGENIYATSGCYGKGEPYNSKIAVDAVDAWYMEVKSYNWKKPGYSGSVGHFSQVIWKSTKYLGLGIGKKGSTCYVTGSYDPPGNYPYQWMWVANVRNASSFTRSSLYQLVFMILPILRLI